jgi:MFS family permease
MKPTERHFNWFLGLLIVSLVGNACADFAVLWHCVAMIGSGTDSVGASRFVTAFYSGQAIGAILLAPFLSAWIDRHARRISSVVLDVTYALVLGLMLAANVFGVLSPVLLFPFGAVTASLGALHRGAIGYGAVKVLSEHLNLTKLVAKFNAAIFTTNLLGSLISGLLYRQLGLNGCLVLAIATFLPMPFIYFKLFPKEALHSSMAPERRQIFSEVKAGLSFIIGDRRLWVNSLVVAIWNVASNIFPGIVGIAFQKSYPGRTDLASIAVSIAILAGVFSFRPIEKIAKGFSLNRIMFYALSPAILALTICAVSSSPFAMALAFMLHCMGAALVNIASGSLRVASVPKSLIGRVNTAHSALVSLGQVFGSVVLIPVLSTSVASGAAMILVAYAISAGLAFILFPSVQLSHAIGEVK